MGEEEPVPGMQGDRQIRAEGCRAFPAVVPGHGPDEQAAVVRTVPAHEAPFAVPEEVAPGEPPVECEGKVAECSLVRDKCTCGSLVKGAPVGGDHDRHVLRRLHPALDF
ncbi:MAG: hypothetical protein WAK75_04825 [Methanoregula sp.]